MRRILFIFLLFQFTVFGQLEFSETKHIFETTDDPSKLVVDFVITNKGSRPEYLLKIDTKSKCLKYLFSSKRFDKDSSMIIRFSVNPCETGKFTFKPQIYFASMMEPVTFTISGNFKGDLALVDVMKACPNFGSTNRFDPNKFSFTVKVIDGKTKEEIPSSKVDYYANGRYFNTHKTNGQGLIEKKYPIGFYYFVASKEGYFSSEKGQMVNYAKNLVIIELFKKEEPKEIIEEEVIIIKEKDSSEFQIQEIPLDSVPPPLEEGEFSLRQYKPNNIVFVIDNSASMASRGKLELLKFSLHELTKILRPQDKITLVSYANSASVILNTTSGDQKERIEFMIDSMVAKGFTAGGAGIKLGFEQAKAAKIPDGNNQVIVVTDGSFNKDSDDYMRYIKKSKNSGISISVVGIKNTERARDEMIDVATFGNGRYIPINDLIQAKVNLIKEIKEASRITSDE
ncbi:MAG: VWA domain-containing protein [Crocinitomicaceae bacterium]